MNANHNLKKSHHSPRLCSLTELKQRCHAASPTRDIRHARPSPIRFDLGSHCHVTSSVPPDLQVWDSHLSMNSQIDQRLIFPFSSLVSLPLSCYTGSNFSPWAPVVESVHP